jgi:hypothetical protein
LTNKSVIPLGLAVFLLITAVGSPSDYNMVVNSANIIAQTDRGSGTTSDPYIIEGKNFNDLTGNGMLVSNTNANIVIKDITTSNLSGSNDYPYAIGIDIQETKNVQIENYTALTGEALHVSDSQNIRVKDYKGRNLFFEGVNGSTIENCTSDNIVIKGQWNRNLFFYNVLDMSKELMNDSENCSIRNCNHVGEIDLFEVNDCLIENCRIEGNGLWLLDATNVIFRNITLVNATLSINWGRKIIFENMTLIKSDISLEGSESKDFEAELRNCTVDGRPIYYYQNRSDLTFDNLDAGLIWLVNCSRSRINSSKVLGIVVINSRDVFIENSEIDQSGVKLAFSQNCMILNNTLLNTTSKKGIIQYASQQV